MNLKQAIESGKRFKRKDAEVWYPVGGYMASGGRYYYTQDDIMADDWITEEPAKQKVTMWQAVFKTKLDNFYIPEGLFKDEYEASKYNVGSSFVKLVNPVEIEI